MSLFKIAWRSIQERALSSFMTGLSMALGVALVVAVLVFQGVISTTFRRAAEGYNLIIGAKGGRLELVLNTVFHLGQPIENIPWDFYKEFTKEGATARDTIVAADSGKLVITDMHGVEVSYPLADKVKVVLDGKPGSVADLTPGQKVRITTKEGSVTTIVTGRGHYSNVIDVAVPYCLGDNYKGYRIVGTTPALFNELGYGIDPQGKPILYRFSQGQSFEQSDFFGAVIGSVVAHRTGLKIGDRFQATHGVTTEEGTGKVHPDDFYVRGILAPNGTPNDRAVFVNMEGFFLLTGHAKDVNVVESAGGGSATDLDHSHPAPLPEIQREVTAILLRTSHPAAPIQIEYTINNGDVAQAVAPIKEIAKLFEGLIGGLQVILLVLAILIVFVASVGIMVSIYNSMSDRRKEIAIMRALGAGRGTVRTLILLESILLSVLGGGAGFLLGHGLIGLSSGYIANQTGVPIGLFQFVIWELVLIPLLIVAASLAGIVPALSAYRTDVARTLSASP